MATLSFVVLFVIVSAFAEAVQIPSSFKICSRDDPSLNACLKESIQAALPALADGYKDGYLNIVPLDPYSQKEQKIDIKRNQISGRFILKNLKTYGTSKSKVVDVRADIEDNFMELEVDMSNDSIFIDGYFNGEGRLSSILVALKGYYNTTMTGLTWTWKISGETELRDGVSYMKVKKFFMRPEVGNLKINLPVVFKNNPEIDQFVKGFINTYWRALYQELLPVVELSWSKNGIKMCNSIFSKIPYDEIFPTSF